MSGVVENFKLIEHNIKKAGAKFGVKLLRTPEIVAVSKNHGFDKIIPLLEYGHRIFGENKVQEAAFKWPDLKLQYKGVKLHMVGPLQTNKAKEALRLFDAIQTVDREKLAHILAHEITASGKNPELMVQVNIGEEEQKAGIRPQHADQFIKHCIHDLKLNITGLMCIPPADEPSGLYFGLLRKIAERNGIKTLSMGMSGDYEAATAMGATHVRIGTAIFGERY